jgi:hypothetical protein
MSGTDFVKIMCEICDVNSKDVGPFFGYIESLLNETGGVEEVYTEEQIEAISNFKIIATNPTATNIIINKGIQEKIREIKLIGKSDNMYYIFFQNYILPLKDDEYQGYNLRTRIIYSILLLFNMRKSKELQKINNFENIEIESKNPILILEFTSLLMKKLTESDEIHVLNYAFYKSTIPIIKIEAAKAKAKVGVGVGMRVGAGAKGGGSLKKLDRKHLNKLFICNDRRARKAFRIKGQGNTVFVMYKGDVIKAREIA